MNIYLIVFIVYFGIIIATSIMGSKKVESMEDFAVGGNKMGLLLGVGTSMATWLSVASVMGVPGNIYSRGVCHYRMDCRLVLCNSSYADGCVQDQETGCTLPYIPGTD